MNQTRNMVFAVALFIAPIVVAWYSMSVAAAVGVVLLLLLLRWLITLSGIISPERTPELVLSSIAASHFVEKVRWSMDRLGIDYVEQTSGGTLGAFFRGRTVPLLKIRTGMVVSTIGNSPEILRYLYGRYLADDPEKAAFLEPTQERLAFEEQLDIYARCLQVWIYHHILADRELTLHAWGADDSKTPAWQRLLLRMLFPLQAALIRFSFKINDTNYARAAARIEKVIGEADAQLADGRKSLLGGDELNYTDLTFAAFTGLWRMPEQYGGGKANAVRIDLKDAPAGMCEDIGRWSREFPRAIAWVDALYETR